MLSILNIGLSQGTTIKTERLKNIHYVPAADKSFNSKRHTLDICRPENISKPLDVIVFVHGGSWNSGKKNTYRTMGKNFAGRDVLWININYRLSPEVQYKDMCLDVARAIKWVKDSIGNYGGNAERIFIAGHSAGGHLGALVAMNDKYFNALGMKNPIKGGIMIDAFCLDLVDFFTITSPKFSEMYYPIFTNNDVEWQEATPANYASRTRIPFITMVGGLTYPGIKIGAERFKRALENEGNTVESYVIDGKKHIPMITQFFLNKKNPYIETIMGFVKKVE